MKAESFLIAVDSTDPKALMEVLVRGFPDAMPIPRADGKTVDPKLALCGVLRGHNIEIVKNDFAAEAREALSNDPFATFLLRIECLPVEETLSVEKQILFARELVQLLRAEGFKIAVGAGFEAEI